MTISVEVTTTNLSKALQTFFVNAFGQRFLDDIASIVLRRNKERFLRAVNPDNIPWPISQSAKRRAAGLPDSQGISKTGSNGNTLFSTGSLFESIQILNNRSTNTERVVSVNPAFKNRVSGKRVLDYAVKHQFGSSSPFLPVRKFLGVNSQDVQVVDSFIDRKLRNLSNTGN